MEHTTNHSRVLNRRNFIEQTGLALAGVALSASAASPPPVSFFVIGDTHFLADKTQPERLDERSAQHTSRLVDMLNRLPGTELPTALGGGQVPTPYGVLHVGHVIDTGDKAGPIHEAMQRTEWAAYEQQFGLTGKEGRLKFPVFELPGNHDSPHGRGHAIERMIARQRARKSLKAVSPNGLHGSWDWEGVHFASLGLIVGTDQSVERKRRYAAMDSLAFLHEDLANTPKDQPLVLPFWLRHGRDREHGGILTCLDRDGSLLDTDKSVWFQGRAAWMFATVASTLGSSRREEALTSHSALRIPKTAFSQSLLTTAATDLLAVSRSCIEFLRAHGAAPDGKLYFTDLLGKPVQEYWHDMKFWWPHNEAIIATLLAWQLTGEPRFAEMHRLVHDWSFKHFPDREHGEWFGYLHRDGRISSRAKGTIYKGPFHLPRCLWYCWQRLEQAELPAT